jgi:LPXTG-motif cell wall-anchored protein
VNARLPRRSIATRPADARAGRWNRAAAVAVLAAAGVAAWWPVLGSGLLRSAPMAVLACLVVARSISARAGTVLLAAWLPAALLLAGLPPRIFRPRALGATGSSLHDGLGRLGDATGARVVGDHWALAVALLALGVTWSLAAILTTRGSGPTVTAMLVLAYPILGAILLQSTPPNAAWHGVVLLAAAMLWSTRGRLAIALPAAALISLVAVTGAQAFGPHGRWINFNPSPRKPAFTRLDPTQSYGPLNSRRTGATMLQITASEPALWRMQVLEDFNGNGWDFGRDRAELPEPAAVPVTTKVRIVGLENRLIAAPGRITAVEDDGGEASRGESWRLNDSPRRGSTYTVTSQVVRATAEQLAKVPIPVGDEYDDYTRLWPRGMQRGAPWGAERVGSDPPDWLKGSPWGEAIMLARRLASGATSELEVVRRVDDYLNSGRFRYTTDVKDPGPDPLLEFLFKTRAGYCQHFAGAAALLLRLAGIPTRVVSGFATGKRTGNDSYVVRDEDAHAWIEVYFPGFGWVPFNPTPASAEADVAPETDVLAGHGSAGGPSEGSALLGILGLGALGGGALFVYRRRRRGPRVALGEVLARLAPEPVGPSVTLTALRPRLATIGPAVAALADEAERARFAADGTREPSDPYLRVWRALAHDLGAVRATRSLLRAAV